MLNVCICGPENDLLKVRGLSLSLLGKEGFTGCVPGLYGLTATAGFAE